ncbi:MAG: malonyl-CoA/methylmalonyl-CoA synthetase [Planctomycetaceae bacterium]
MEDLQLVSRARSHGNAIAIRSGADEWSYAELLDRSAALTSVLLAGSGDLREARIAFLVPAGFDYAAVQWAIWRAGGVAVPLSVSATEPELEYTLTDSGASCVVVTAATAEKVSGLCERLGLRLLVVDEVGAVDLDEVSLPTVTSDRRAMILYTSGTTSKPKGVVTTHANIQAQIESLIEAWKWESADRIPLFLPLHHIHGIINILSCGLWAGATVETFPRFEMASVLERVAAREYSVFMAVPTIYVKLIQTLEAMAETDRDPIVQGFSEMRLMISGSAALPASVHDKWFALTGQKLLERYGMTEIGMGLSNPYDGERRPGAVGQALPKVEIRLKSENGDVVDGEDEPGEIQVRGPGVFVEYWNRPDITDESFDQDWFRTGDIAVRETGYYRIMGRQSVDIIKSGGYKLSALEIEAACLDHPAICEAAVVGLPDDTWGEVVALAAVLESGEELSLESLRESCQDRLSKYRIPSRLLVVDELPRNAMGKVTKPAVCDLFRFK